MAKQNQKIIEQELTQEDLEKTAGGFGIEIEGVVYIAYAKDGTKRYCKSREEGQAYLDKHDGGFVIATEA